MTRALLALACAAVAATAGALLSLSSPIAPAAAPVAAAQWGLEIDACGPSQPCLVSLGERATKSGQFAQFADALSSAGILCHEAAHKMSASAITSGEDPARWLAMVAPRGACLDGLIHGVFDSYLPAHAEDQEKVRALLSVCHTLAAEFAEPCADGAGHGLYQATHDTGKALQSCLLLESDKLKESCIGGIAMQMFRPEADGSRPADFPLDQVTTVGVGFCRQVAQEASATLAMGCAVGLTLPYTEELDRETRTAAETPGSDLVPVRDMWLEKADGCSDFDTWAEVCRDALGTRLGFSTMAAPSSRDMLCKPEVLRRSCIAVTPLAS